MSHEKHSSCGDDTTEQTNIGNDKTTVKKPSLSDYDNVVLPGNEKTAVKIRSPSEYYNVELAGRKLENVEVLYNYNKEYDTDLSIKKGDILTVIKKADEHWWTGRLGRVEGVFPRNYTKPYELQDNRFRVIRQYEATKDDEITVEVEDVVTMINKHASKLYVSLREKEGWIPEAHVAPVDDDECPTVPPRSKEMCNPGSLVEVLYTYDKRNDGELSIKRGDILTVVHKNNENWWTGKLGRQKGLFPRNFARFCDLQDKTFRVIRQYNNDEITVEAGDVVTMINRSGLDLYVSLREHEGWIPEAYVTSVTEFQAYGGLHVLPPRSRKSESEMESCSRTDLPSADAHIYAVPNLVNKKELRILMVGKTGTGKSAFGNAILEQMYFESKTSGRSVTWDCKRGETEILNRKVVVVDTPGLFDTILSAKEITQNISRCVHMLLPGPHVFLLFIQIGRFTKEEIEALNSLFDMFGEKMKQCSILIFTRLDDLERENRTIESFIEDTGEPLKRYISDCGGRYFAVNNFAPIDKKKETVKTILSKIDQVVKENGDGFFTNEMFDEANNNLEKAFKAKASKLEKENEELTLKIKTEFKAKFSSIKKGKDEVEKEIQAERHKQTIKLNTVKPQPLFQVEEEGKDQEIEETTIKRLQEMKKEMEKMYDLTKREEASTLSRLQKEHTNRKEEILMEVHQELQRDMESKFIKQMKEMERKMKNIDVQLSDKGGLSYESLEKLNKERRSVLKKQKQYFLEQAQYFESLEKRSDALQKKLTKTKTLCPIM